jgi:hypothetical protein
MRKSIRWISALIGLLLLAPACGGTKSPTTSFDEATFCTSVKTAAASDFFNKDSTVDFGDPTAVRVTMEDGRKVLTAMRGAAPAELSAPLGVLTAAFESNATVAASAGFDLTKVDPKKMVDAESDPAVAAAQKQVDTFTRANCGVALGS